MNTAVKLFNFTIGPAVGVPRFPLLACNTTVYNLDQDITVFSPKSSQR